ncbi:hypothetical protein [Brevibacterium aurantiacum]|uniref:Uncharacterized protein n=1 Tax=Brevibacterium aurantiacum TaxID=273384 RepID=A0A556C5J2_BREAU|nr:hypothetical protein [Brevibacterium aurantiacum]TSI12650.1 hypothetical protein FO013_19445 [Brevibacterium aurantiacum]
MNSLPGNPHHYEANTDAPNGDYQVAQALLALAHEKRTENLIAWRRQLMLLALDAQASDVGGIINERLGLNGGDDERCTQASAEATGPVPQRLHPA